jgi:hypothetical protein
VVPGSVIEYNKLSARSGAGHTSEMSRYNKIRMRVLASTGFFISNDVSKTSSKEEKS